MVEVLLNLQAILLTSGVKTTSGLAAAILNFWLPVSSSSVCNNLIEKLDPKNAGVVVGILSLSRLRAEIYEILAFSRRSGRVRIRIRRDQWT